VNTGGFFFLPALADIITWQPISNVLGMYWALNRGAYVF
jgi:hypothetical protein